MGPLRPCTSPRFPRTLRPHLRGAVIPVCSGAYSWISTVAPAFGAVRMDLRERLRRQPALSPAAGPSCLPVRARPGSPLGPLPLHLTGRQGPGWAVTGGSGGGAAGLSRIWASDRLALGEECRSQTFPVSSSLLLGGDHTPPSPLPITNGDGDALKTRHQALSLCQLFHPQTNSGHYYYCCCYSHFCE